MEASTFASWFVFMALVGGPLICVVAIVVSAVGNSNEYRYALRQLGIVRFTWHFIKDRMRHD